MTAFTAPDSSSSKRVVAGNPRALFSNEAVSTGTETIFIAVVEFYPKNCEISKVSPGPVNTDVRKK